MKKNLVILLLFFSPSTFSQGINNLWVMGSHSWAGPPFGGINMDFTGGTLNVSYQNMIMNFGETNCAITNGNGSLLFSSNGIFVANALNDTMMNGEGLNPAYYTQLNDSNGLFIPQGNLVIPFPNDSTKYYLFHETCDDYGYSDCSLHLHYSVIDMTLDSGRGAVVQKNTILLNDSLVLGRLTACKHANGRDWWLVTHQYHTDTYYKYLVTPYGIQGPYTQSIGSIRDINFGQIVFSQDGNKFAFYEPTADLDLLDFDRCTGVFSNLVHVDINDSASGVGVAFSPNSNVLYLASMNYVYQFDLTAPNIPASQLTVAIYDGYYSPQYPLATLFYLAQLAPDGKIYIICSNGTLDIHVIDFPNNIGTSCNVCQHCVALPAYNHFTIANNPNYFLEAKGGTICDSLGLPNSTRNWEEKNKITFSPNPFSDRLTFYFNQPQKDLAKLNVFNSIGKLVFENEILMENQTLILSALHQGIYLVSVRTDKGIFTEKIVKE